MCFAPDKCQYGCKGKISPKGFPSSAAEAHAFEIQEGAQKEEGSFMKKIFCAIICCMLCVLLAACGTTDIVGADHNTPAPGSDSTAAPTQTPLVQSTPKPTVALPKLSLEEYPRVDGSTANIPLIDGLIRLVTGCTEQEAEERSTVSGTDNAYAALAENKADMLLVYGPSDATIEELSLETTMDMYPIGFDALVFIVNEDNPIESLTAEQIQDIYSGKITNWKEVGGLDSPIMAFQRPYLSGSQTMMLNLCMKDVEPMEPKEETIADSMSDIVTAVEAYNNSANAIGYSVYYYAKNMYARPGIKFIGVNGVEPSNESINSREYPFISEFFGVIGKKSANQQAQALLDWLRTEEGQLFIQNCGYVPYMRIEG